MSKPTAWDCKGCGSVPIITSIGTTSGIRYHVKCGKESCWVGPAEPTQKAAAFKWNMAMRRVK